MKEIVERLKAPMNKFWIRFRNLCIALAGIIPSTEKLSEYMGWIPQGFVPDWVKALIGGMILMGIFTAQLTHDKDTKNE